MSEHPIQEQNITEELPAEAVTEANESEQPALSQPPEAAAEPAAAEEPAEQGEEADEAGGADALERFIENREQARKRRCTRRWGVLIGVSLGLLCLACIALLAGILARAAGGVQIGTGSLPGIGPGPVQDPSQPDEAPEYSDTRLQVYDVPDEEGAYTTSYIAAEVMDSVVGILTYDGTSIDSTGGGTGIIMSEDGYIVTNAHVVVDAEGLTVVLHDESRYTAKVLGYDEKTDLAVIKINATGLKPAQFGNSDQVVVGERAIAIGNPGGLTGSVSQGIISGKDREITITLSDGTGAVISALQTDAAINPGNSGGPLLNAWGQVIGINSSKIVKNGYEGLGFAIPVNQAQPIIDNLIQYGYVKDRAVLGITIIALDATNGPANGLPSQGLYIASVAEYSYLARLGIMAGDVILEANGVEMITTDDLADQLAQFRPGDTITMKILQTYDGDVVTVEVLLLDSRAAG